MTQTLSIASTYGRGYFRLAKKQKGPVGGKLLVSFAEGRRHDRFAHRRLNRTLTETQELMKMQDVWTAQHVLTEALSELRALRARGGLAEFTRDAFDLYHASYVKKQKQIGELGILFGWPTLDKMSAGMRPGDVVSIIGRPAMGKTFKLLHIALDAAMRQKKKVLLLSMEMMIPELTERLVAMHTHMPMSDVQKGELTTKQKTAINSLLLKAKDAPGRLWIVDGNLTATVNDVFGLVYQLNPDLIVIDGAYLLRHEDRRLDRYKRVEINTEEIKRRASEFGIPALLSFQFNREAAKKQLKSKGKEKGGLEDIAFSDSVGQLSSIVLGLFEEESVETLHARVISILKGRSGEVGSFKIFWEFPRKMN